MAKIVVPNTGAGFNSTTENLVGFQSVQGGGLTNTNFTFDYGVTEKITQEYQEGVFSDPITLDSLNIDSIEEARITASKDLKVYPNYDLTEVTNFTLYGSLTKRLEVSVTQIINYFPAALEVDQVYFDYTTAFTCSNVVPGIWFVTASLLSFLKGSKAVGRFFATQAFSKSFAFGF